ncbi:hypothetical protein [Streptomyces hygroscopicus]|uniref:hypothetical protein n=1 Tax=Streptomyces hygroscopicus TaxID=1912 RepID=UPI0033BFD5E1
MTQPIEARCDHCKQTRPLFLYQPTHNAHFGFATCRWCARDKQPLLCVRCWGAERELEENDPFLNEEAETMAKICATNARIAAREEADKATCEGIAAATQKAEGGAQ